MAPGVLVAPRLAGRGLSATLLVLLLVQPVQPFGGLSYLRKPTEDQGTQGWLQPDTGLGAQLTTEYGATSSSVYNMPVRVAAGTPDRGGGTAPALAWGCCMMRCPCLVQAPAHPVAPPLCPRPLSPLPLSLSLFAHRALTALTRLANPRAGGHSPRRL